MQGCPDTKSQVSTKHFKDGVIWIAGMGIEKRWSYDKCPGYYLRPEAGHNVCGKEMYMYVFWMHYEFDKGLFHLCKNGEYPPKLLEAIKLLELERRAYESLYIKKQNNESKAVSSGKGVIARG